MTRYGAWGIRLYPYLRAMNNLERLHWVRAILKISHTGCVFPINRSMFLKIWQPQYFDVCNVIAWLARRYRERLQAHEADVTQPRWMPRPKYEAIMCY